MYKRQEDQLSVFKELKRGLEKFLIIMGQTKQQLNEMPEAAFREELPEEFRQLLDPNISRRREKLVNDYENLAFDTLCCLIASDRRISKSERLAVVNEMQSIGTSSKESELQDRLDDFIERVKVTGLRTFKASVLDRVKCMSKSGVPIKPILTSVVAVAHANEDIADEERAFCVEIEAVLSSAFERQRDL